MVGFMQNSESGEIEFHIGDNQYDECMIVISKEVAIQIRDYLNGIKLE